MHIVGRPERLYVCTYGIDVQHGRCQGDGCLLASLVLPSSSTGTTAFHQAGTSYSPRLAVLTLQLGPFPVDTGAPSNGQGISQLHGGCCRSRHLTSLFRRGIVLSL